MHVLLIRNNGEDQQGLGEGQEVNVEFSTNQVYRTSREIGTHPPITSSLPPLSLSR
jgi:hypothetical protein